MRKIKKKKKPSPVSRQISAKVKKKKRGPKGI